MIEPAQPPHDAPHRRTAALAFIFVTITIDMLAFGIIIPVLPHLIEQFVGGDVATASRWTGTFSVVFATAQFVFTPIQGALSDRFGRRVVILLSCLGLGLDFLLIGAAKTLTWLLVGRLISGMTAASFSTSNAYVADVTPPEKRGDAYGKMGAAFGIGFVVGPALGGLLSGIDLRAPFWGAACLALCNFVYGLVVLPESLPPSRRSPRFDWHAATAIGAIANLKRFRQVTGLIWVALLYNVAHYVFPATFVLYADYRFGWDAKRVGWVLAGVGICGAVVQAGLSGRVIAAIGERRTLLVGSFFGVIGFLVCGLAPTGAWFALIIPFLALWDLASPAAQSMMSRQVGPSEQGRLQGALAGVESFAGIFAPFAFAELFAFAIDTRTTTHLPGIGFLLSALLVLCSLVVASRTTRDAN